MTININDFWESNYYNHPTLTDKMIEQAEKELGVKLPDTFLNLLKVQNGGYTKGFVFPMTEETSWAENHIPFDEMFGIVTDKSIDTSHNILDTEYMTKEWGLPEKQVLLSGDGHWWITLDYRKSENPSVSWITADCDEDIHIADSFENFINGLISEDEFTG